METLTGISKKFVMMVEEFQEMVVTLIVKYNQVLNVISIFSEIQFVQESVEMGLSIQANNVMMQMMFLVMDALTVEHKVDGNAK